MPFSRRERVKSLLKKLAADFLKTGVEAGVLVTVTDFIITSNMRTATIFVSIFPEKEEKETLLFLQKKKGEFKKYLSAHTKMKTIPFIVFAIDRGEKNRQRIDELLREATSKD